MDESIQFLQKKLYRQLEYYGLRHLTGKLSKDDYFEKIRPITYRLRWLLIIRKIENVQLSIESLKANATNFFKLGTPELFLIKKLNGCISQRLDYDAIYKKVELLYESSLNNIVQDLQKLSEDDFLDELISD